MADIRVRPATAADLDAINEIFNHFVERCTCTYQTVRMKPEERAAWFAAHDAKHPVIVAEREGVIVGWASLSPFRPQAAYEHTVEDTIYVHEAYQAQGIGSMLMGNLLVRAKTLGHRTVIAVIDALQTGSITLHARSGFVEVARLKEVGFKFGRWLDQVYMQRML